MPQKVISNDFGAIALSIASPEKILAWSHGEVLKPETINYRTQKPERDGLFCERIFGPTKNWQCYCGKYKKMKYRGIVCEKCGVEVTRSIVRRERMGHIKLAVPITHIWFLRSTPSRLGLLLNVSIKHLEQVVGFAAYIIKNVNEEARQETLDNLKKEANETEKKIKEDMKKKKTDLQKSKDLGKGDLRKSLSDLEDDCAKKLDKLKASYLEDRKLLEGLRRAQILDEKTYVYLRLDKNWGHVFEAGIGAEALREILSEIDLSQMLEELKKELRRTVGQKKKKTFKQIRLVGNLIKAKTRPEWMIWTILPVLPPDLRPMVELEGGRFAASDLNDLYRRVINRNNRLKRLVELQSPEIICRNEKRMLQEAVDALINNAARAGKAIFTTGHNRKYKSLSDFLRGKQGRFRQNLLGKRVDYSGRSVIVVGPQLRLHQCGIPKRMALELFRPFVIARLLRDGYAYNFKNAERMIEWNRREVWDALEEVTKDYYVLLNRAPTLHRLGIQAFQPILIEGKAIQIHPLVCEAYNADFDGDQMAVHLPLSAAAQQEAKQIMASSRNLLKPATGDPIIAPRQDIVLGCYFLTRIIEGAKGEGMVFSSVEEAKNAYSLGYLDLRAKVKVRLADQLLVETTMGRVIFNDRVPKDLGFINETLNKKALKKLIIACFNKLGREETILLSDAIKDTGFYYASFSGISIAASDLEVPPIKGKIIEDALAKIDIINRQRYRYGFITDDERYLSVIKVWTEAKRKIEEAVRGTAFDKESIFSMVDSGARGSWENLTQMAGMKGMVVDPSGRIIELPIRACFKEGFSILEYFIATHGARKGKTDTALRTAEAGYLTRRLVDAVQDIVVREEDCGTTEYHTLSREDSDRIGEEFSSRVFGRVLAKDLVDPKTGEILLPAGTEMTKENLDIIDQHNVSFVDVRSPMLCRTNNGICQKCYGTDLGLAKIVEIGTPVGIIAAQSIGEPGTQLTMRTFHSGGVAREEKDITQGLTRVEEIFEARPPKPQAEAVMADFSGKIKINHSDEYNIVALTSSELLADQYLLVNELQAMVKKGDKIKEKQVIARQTEGKDNIKARHNGVVEEISKDHILVRHEKKMVMEYRVPPKETILVADGDDVQAGAQLTFGHLPLKKLMRATSHYDVQRYMIQEIQKIYTSQGQSIHDKHVEVITRQMLSKAKVVDSGDSHYFSGEIKGVYDLEEENAKLKAAGKREVVYERLLMGLTKVALATESWLSAASFQETIRVLIQAAVSRKVDYLRGLKENVIIGRLIPAGEYYRQNNQKKRKS